MKKLATLIAVAAIFAFPFAAGAKAPPYQITFESFTTPHAVSGATSIAAASGTTKLVGVHSGQKRTTGNQYVDMSNPAQFGGMGPMLMVWLEDLDFCPAQINNAGTVSDTFDAWLELFPKNGLTSSVTRYLFEDEPITSLQNNTAGPHFIKIPPRMYAVPYIKSGTTALGNVRIGALVGYSDDAGFEETTLTFDEQHSAFATTGVSNNMTSGGTGFTLPNGAEWFGFFAKGDDVPYSTDDTDADTSGLYFPDGKEKILPRSEVEELGTAANGSSAGTLTMTPYSRRPY